MEEAKVGSLNLPIGFRFHPTDEELLVHYLTKKILSMLLPALIIPQLDDIFHSFPCDLPGDFSEKRYFFSKTNGHMCGKLMSSRDCCGYWKATGQDRLIEVLLSQHQQGLLLGMKKAFRFYQIKQTRNLKTRWVMHQYSLVTFSLSDQTTSQNVNMMQAGDWSIFRVYQKKLKSKNVIRAQVNALQCNRKKTRKRSLNAGLLHEKESHCHIF